jgi:hypothetical protein
MMIVIVMTAMICATRLEWLWYILLISIHDDRPESNVILITTSLNKEEPGWLSFTALGYGLDGRGFESWQRLGIFLFTTVPIPALGPTQPPIQWVPWALSLGLKWPEREADHSPPSSAEVNNEWSYSSTPPIRLHGVVLS